MVPGYTGYIPKHEDHFGTRYAENCKNAIDDFARDMNTSKDRRKQLTRQPPKTPVRVEAKPYVSLNQVQHSVSPYFMNINNPAKTFMPGYTGFIPRARSRFAMDYPNLTREALVDFTQRQQHLKKLDKKPVVLNQQCEKSNASSPGCKQAIYINGGLLPHYTGYLPGHKFRFGDTFGTSSRYFHAAANRRSTTAY
uniref:Ciliary microtubule inner protein 2B n=1 Tax=Phallusia mammillata TaxID=59560 RepID=A0A6F9DD85_9ASCI|nr:protein FAM166B-like [Phallusia mammillata]